MSRWTWTNMPPAPSSCFGHCVQNCWDVHNSTIFILTQSRPVGSNLLSHQLWLNTNHRNHQEIAGKGSKTVKYCNNMQQASWSIMEDHSTWNISSFVSFRWCHGARPGAFWQHSAHVHRELADCVTKRIETPKVLSLKVSKASRCEDHQAPPVSPSPRRESPDLSCRGSFFTRENGRVEPAIKCVIKRHAANMMQILQRKMTWNIVPPEYHFWYHWDIIDNSSLVMCHESAWMVMT